MSANLTRRTFPIVFPSLKTIGKARRVLFHRLPIFWIVLLSWASPVLAKIGTQYQMALGNPSLAAMDAAQRTNYLLLRPQYALSYNESTLQPNWVSWSYSLSDSGTAGRSDAWSVETELPTGFQRVGTGTFGTGWDRGHMTPSADRTASLADNLETFRMSNAIPQAEKNNRDLWLRFEDYCRAMAADGDEVLVTSGPAHFTGSRLSNGMEIPASVWKIAVEIPNAASPLPAGERITEETRVIAILTPNHNGELGTWQSYITSVEAIEDATGFDFFGGIVDASTAVYLKNVVDTGNGPNKPTVVTAFDPLEATPGTPVTIWGYHFGPAPVVKFGGTQALNVTVNGNNTLSAVIPPGAPAGTENITVTGSGGTDISYEQITIRSGTLPFLRLSNSTLTGLFGLEGKPGTARAYTLSGANLDGPVTITASALLEVALQTGAFSHSVTVQPTNRAIAGTILRVRIKSNAPAGSVLGSINHASPGAESISLAASGTVRSSAPHLVLPAGPLEGFSTLQGRSSAPRMLAVTGFNLTGNILATAPAGFEISLNNVNFRPSLTLLQRNGVLSTPLYVRLSRTAAAGTVSANLTFTGGGIAPRTHAISGRVGAPGSTSTVSWDLTQAGSATDVPTGLFAGHLAHGNNAANTTLLSTSSISSGYQDASGGYNAAATARTGAFSIENSTFFEFTLAPDPYITATLSGLSFAMRSSSTGPQAYSIRNSLDDFSTEMASGQVPANGEWHLRSHSNLALSTSAPVTFRIYGFNGTGSGNPNWRIDDLRFDVTTSLVQLLRPVVLSPAATSGKVGTPFSHQIVASNLAHGFGALLLPPGLTINASTGLISGTPARDGNFTVQIQAANMSGVGTQNLTVSIAATTPVITGANATTSQVGTAFSYRITAANAPRTFQATGLPAGLSVNASTGFITGTPAESGNFTVTLSAANSAGTGTRSLSLTILPPPPVVFGPSSANATVGSPFRFQATATNSPTRFSANGLPLGLKINATTGLIEGIPAVDGTFVVKIGASNSGGATVRGFTLTVAPILPVFTSATTVVGRLGLAFQFQPLAIHAPRTFAASGLPPGLSINATTGLVSGIPTELGNYTVTLSATNPAGTATQSHTLVIRPPLPVLTSPLTAQGTAAAPFSYQIAASNQPFQFGASGLPAGLRINIATGLISGTPVSPGVFRIKISATNSGGTRVAEVVLTIDSAQ